MKRSVPVERRRSQRIKVQKGVVAVNQDDQLSISRLIDINLNGLSMIQPSSGELQDGAIELDILALHEEDGKDLFLSNIKAGIVSEVTVKSDSLNPPTEHKRYGLHFKNLNDQQHEDLKQFIFWHSPS